MGYPLRCGLSDAQYESVKELWECVAALPEKHMKSYLKDLKEVAMLLEMDSQDFYEATGGYYLYCEQDFDVDVSDYDC
jgi:hypothetical protein